MAAHNGDTFITNAAGHYLTTAGSGYAALDAQPLVVNGAHLTVLKADAFVRYKKANSESV